MWETLVQKAFWSGRLPLLSRGEREWLLSRYPSARFYERGRLRARIAAVGEVLRAVETYFPKEGWFLDLGCGYGFVAHWLAREPGRRVVGADLSASSVQVAQRSLCPPNLEFRREDFRAALESGDSWEGIVVVDALVYLSREEQRRFFERARERLAPNGWLLLRDSATEPRWKFAWMRFEERLKRRIPHYYGAEIRDVPLTYRSLEEWRSLLVSFGWRVEMFAVCGRWTPYAGWMAVCQSGEKLCQNGTFEGKRFPEKGFRRNDFHGTINAS